MKDALFNTSKKLLLLAGLFVLLNAIYGATLWYYDVDIHSDTLENLWPHEIESDILYFGESSNFYTEHPDTPKVRISHYLNNMIPELRIHHVDNAGLVASNYLHIMRHIPKESEVQAIVVTMNMRSFGPTWIFDSNSNYLKKADELIKPRPKLLNRFFIALKTYEYLDESERQKLLTEAWRSPLSSPYELPYPSLDEWNKGIGNGGILREDGSWDMDKIPLACQHIKNFAFHIDFETNPRVKDFDAIVELAKERDWLLAFHLLSVNIDETRMLLGEELALLMEENTRQLVERYESHGVLVINNLHAVPESEFRDRTVPTEHYNNFGKKLCAEMLRKELNEKWTQKLVHE